MLCVILRGNEKRWHGAHDSQWKDPTIDTVVGNKMFPDASAARLKKIRNHQNDELVLRDSSQCVPVFVISGKSESSRTKEHLRACDLCKIVRATVDLVDLWINQPLKLRMDRGLLTDLFWLRPPGVPLPPPWELHRDPKSGGHFFYNPRTKEATWERPT